MGNKEKLESVFVDGLAIPSGSDFESLTYRGIEEWDSLAHMQLIGEIENAFDIMLDTQDVIGMSSFPKAREIIAKYGVDFDDGN